MCDTTPDWKYRYAMDAIAAAHPRGDASGPVTIRVARSNSLASRQHAAIEDFERCRTRSPLRSALRSWSPPPRRPRVRVPRARRSKTSPQSRPSAARCLCPCKVDAAPTARTASISISATVRSGRHSRPRATRPPESILPPPYRSDVSPPCQPPLPSTQAVYSSPNSTRWTDTGRQRRPFFFADRISRPHPCKSRITKPVRLAGAVADGSPCHPWAEKPVPQRGTPSAVPSNPNSRGGRNASPIAQGGVKMDAIYVGIDVSKDRLDVHVRPSGEAFAVTRDGKGLDALVERLRALSPTLIAVEATGGFETIVAATVGGAGLPLVVVNPAQIRHFA